MNRIIEISIRDRIAWQTNREGYICDNSDFAVAFDFDSEWENVEPKTARFVHGESYTDVVFTGNQCPVPVITDASKMAVGVFAGNVKTTTPATVICKKSILCGDGVPADPTPDVYTQIMEVIVPEAVLKAEESAKAAETAKTGAETAQTNAEHAQTMAEQSAANANTAEQNATNAQDTAQEAARQAELSRQGAAQAETNVGQLATNAERSANEAADSARKAALSEQNTTASVEEAKKATEDAKTSEENAKQSESNAKTSEENAKQSEENAKTHMNRASNYESDAYYYSQNAKKSATNANTSEVNAKESEQKAEAFAESAAESAKRLGDVVVLAEIPHPDPENIGKAIVVNEDGTGFVFGESGSSEAIDTGALFGSTEKLTEMLPETNIDFPAGQIQRNYLNTPDDVQLPFPELNNGCYVVYWRGVPYECAVQYVIGTAGGANSRTITLGNVSGVKNVEYVGIDMTVDSGEPFLIVAAYGEYENNKFSNITVYRLDDQEAKEDIPVKIFFCEKEPNQMPIKYLPDGVPCRISGFGVILPDCTITTDEDMMKIPRLNLVTGNTYTVKIKGVGEFTCVAFVGEMEGISVVYVGNSMAFGGEDTGEPFVLMELPPEIAAQMGADVAIIPIVDEFPDPVTFSVWGDVNEVRKLHPECLPDDATVFHLTSPNGTRYAIAVDDSGNIKVTEAN